MLKVHFLNVGHGDCTIIEHSNGNLTVIDINNAKDLDITTQQELSLFSQIIKFDLFDCFSKLICAHLSNISSSNGSS